ncbi:hypothetical protein E3Q13_03844 [Wallemia mellicola]|nr:hypothetical protein E3Q13_03844 [Wallemia mellicola]TIC20878.1 hypothetical protein E3Q12_03676 [Wallemia mellicola]
MSKIALVFGATGISGIAVIDVLLKDSSYERVIGISRRPIDRKGVVHISIDLDDIEEQNSVNNELFDNSISAVSKACPNIKSFHLQTSYKYYMPGFTAEKFSPLPFKEDSKRQGHINWQQWQKSMVETGQLADHVQLLDTRKVIGCLCLLLPHYMLLDVRSSVKKLHYPGPLVCCDMDYDNSTAKNNAEFQLYAVENVHNRAFNINDGKPYQFSTLWPQIAAYFGLELPSPPAQDVKIEEREYLKVVHSVTEWAERHKNDFPRFS